MKQCLVQMCGEEIEILENFVVWFRMKVAFIVKSYRGLA